MTTTKGGIELGPNSPLLTEAQARKKLQLSEFEIQASAMRLLVGQARPGVGRMADEGMTGRFPELALLHAIPNGEKRHKATAGKLKASGVLASMPDLCLPVARWPFYGLYVEVKVPGKMPTITQRATHELLRAQGHCVLVCWTVEQIVQAIVGYLAAEQWGESYVDADRRSWHAFLQPPKP